MDVVVFVIPTTFIMFINYTTTRVRVCVCVTHWTAESLQRQPFWIDTRIHCRYIITRHVSSVGTCIIKLALDGCVGSQFVVFYLNQLILLKFVVVNHLSWTMVILQRVTETNEGRFSFSKHIHRVSRCN